jgi:hypothetical protein
MRSALRHAWFRDAAPRRLFALILHHAHHPLFITDNELSRTAPAYSDQKPLSGLSTGFLDGQPCPLVGRRRRHDRQNNKYHM